MAWKMARKVRRKIPDVSIGVEKKVGRLITFRLSCKARAGADDLFAERTSPRRPRPGTLAAHQNDALARAAQVAPPEKAGDRLSPKCMRRIRDELDETDDDLPPPATLELLRQPP